MNRLFFALLLSIITSAVSAQPETQFLSCLLQNSDDSTISHVFYPSHNSSYPSILKFYVQNSRFTSPSTPKPTFILTPVHESHIQTAIYCSKKQGLQMRIRSCGHDFEGSSYISQEPFFVLDLFNFRSISIDLETRTAWAGAGATLGGLYYAIKEKNSSLGFPAGNWPSVCVGGHITGGGYGPLVRNYGLAADNVVDAIIIDAEGRILDRKSMGEDLFWAIRGGVGASFGVILSFKLKLVDVPKNPTVFIVTRTLEQNATGLVYKWQKIAPKLPLKLFMPVHLTTIESSQKGRATIQARFMGLYHGVVNELISLMGQHFPELGLVASDCIQVTWVEYFALHLNRSLDAVRLSSDETDRILTNRVSPFKPYFKGKGDFVQQPIPIEGLEKIWDLFLKIDIGVAEMEWTPFGGKMDEISESEIPFPHRAGNSFIVFKAVYWDGENTAIIEKRLNWMKKLHRVMGKYVANNPRGAFADYRDLDLGVNEIGRSTSVEKARAWGAAYFKNNFDRLVKIKTAVDPEDFFRNEQSIPPLLPYASS